MKQENGTYTWQYDLDMKENKSVFSVTLMAVLGSLLPIFLFLVYLSVKDGVSPDDLLMTLMITGGTLLVILLITVFAYKLVSTSYGGTYRMLFRMDETGIGFRRISGRAETEETVTDRYRMDGYSDFAKVRKIRCKRESNLIYVISSFLINMIYVPEKDYDFVYRYICERCPQARV